MAATSYALMVLLFVLCYVVIWLGSISLVGGVVALFGIPVFAFLSSVFSALVFLLLSLRSEPLSRALPGAAISYMVLPYIAFTLALLIF